MPFDDPVARIEKVGRQVSRQAKGIQHALEKLEDVEDEKRRKQIRHQKKQRAMERQREKERQIVLGIHDVEQAIRRNAWKRRIRNMRKMKPK